MILDKSNLEEVKAYEEFINNSPYASFSQDMAWAKVKENWESVYFYIKEDGLIKAALSVIYIRDGKIGKNFFYAPKGPVCDFKDVDLVKRLLEEAKDYAKANDGFLLRVDPHVLYDEDLIKLYEENGIEIRYDETTSSQPLLNMALEIRGRSPEEILKDFSKNTRKHINRSYRDGIVTKIEDKSKLYEFYDQLKIMSERQGINHRPFEYFERMYDAFGDKLVYMLTSYKGEALCSSLLLTSGDRCTSLYGASNNKYRSMYQNYQIIFEEIKYAAENGYAYYDMGGIFKVDESDGLYKFKKQFTEGNVEKLIGEIDLVIDQDLYDEYIKEKNPHYKREEENKED